ncbi:MAG: TetR/AcrR family transcriptional regulator [Pseudonocardia sp.]|nr:TetR/AcrR family transcriptional regulator [Pseudonocardia sp.]MDN5916300.1 TetR/AcrR family transcriptional regulator [Pseudonocardia sp.]MDN5933060.1 TetR/AcrR family transcriptional regulator [Pseudonocardia sp.]
MLQRQPTREAIVQAALRCVAGGDWEGTSLQTVRQRAGVSNGSLFHHFRTRQDLTAAVIAAALEEHQRVLLEELSADAASGVAGVVRRHLRWVHDNQAVARLLLSAAPDVLRSSMSEPVLEANRRFFEAVAEWLREHGWQTRPELGVVLALWIGPAQEYSRQWLAAPGKPAPTTAADDLALGAWTALAPLLHQAGNGENTATEGARQ